MIGQGEMLWQAYRKQVVMINESVYTNLAEVYLNITCVDPYSNQYSSSQISLDEYFKVRHLPLEESRSQQPAAGITLHMRQIGIVQLTTHTSPHF